MHVLFIDSHTFVIVFVKLICNIYQIKAIFIVHVQINVFPVLMEHAFVLTFVVFASVLFRPQRIRHTHLIRLRHSICSALRSLLIFSLIHIKTFYRHYKYWSKQLSLLFLSSAITVTTTANQSPFHPLAQHTAHTAGRYQPNEPTSKNTVNARTLSFYRFINKQWEIAM